MNLFGLQDSKTHSVLFEPKAIITELKVDFNDVIEGKDEWSVENKISQKVVYRLLDHVLLRSIIIVLLLGSCIVISCQTDPELLERYAIFFATFEQILVTIFLWEMLLKWYYGFWIFWKDIWNIADFFLTIALFIGSTVSFTRNNEFIYVLRVLRALRMVRSLAAIRGLAVTMQVIGQSVSDMANIIFLLILITLVFAVFGVIIFSTHVPEHFGSLEKAIYSLFICITLDGWVQIYEEFVDRDGSIMYWAALYFFFFMIGAAFIFANIMVAAAASNLEEVLLEQEEEKRHRLASDASLLTELKDESESDSRSDLIHMQECMKQITVAHKQQPMKYSSLENLNLTTYEEFCMVLEAIQRNLLYYKQIRFELNNIVKELRDILFNREQQKQITQHEKRIMDITEALLTNDMPTFKKKEMLSNMLTFEKQVRRINNSPTVSLYSRSQENPLTSSHTLRHMPDN